MLARTAAMHGDTAAALWRSCCGRAHEWAATEVNTGGWWRQAGLGLVRAVRHFWRESSLFSVHEIFDMPRTCGYTACSQLQ